MKAWLRGIGVPSHTLYYERGTDALIVHETPQTLVKIPRVDANYDPIHEARVLRYLKSRDTSAPSPRLYSYSPFHVRMERVTCPPIELKLREGPLSRELICGILEASHRLDLLGVDHGELRRPYKHVRICPGPRVVFIDFGRASLVRRPSNLSALASFVLQNTVLLEKGLARVIEVRRRDIITLLRAYKKTPQEPFSALMGLLGCGG